MDFETAQKGIDLMCAHSDGLQDLHIAFFGGEPLLNFSLMKQVVAYCTEMEQKHGKKFRYNMTTNGTILNDEMYRFIKDHAVATMISMDGGKAVQDTYRCYENGAGSYDQVVRNLPRFKEAMKDSISVRATVCRPHLNLKQIKDDLHRLGFTNVSLITVDAPSDSPLFVGEESREELMRGYLELADDYIRCIKEGHGYACYSFDMVLKSLYFKEIRKRSCNAGRNGFALGTDGNLYVCQRFMSMPDYAVGNVSDGIQWDAIQAYVLADVHRKEDCADCWARYLCGGSCLNTCVTQAGDILKAPQCYCGIYKGLYEIGLYIYHELKSWNDDVFNDVFKRYEEMMEEQTAPMAP